jgi:hypothetical protein
MLKTIIILCAAAIAFGADDPWAKVKELKTGSELQVYKRGSVQPLTVKMDELTDQNLIVINKNAQTAILRDDIERIDARPSGKTRTVNETKVSEKNAATDPRSTIRARIHPGRDESSYVWASSGVTWSKPGFETVYRRTARERRRSRNTTMRVFADRPQLARVAAAIAVAVFSCPVTRAAAVTLPVEVVGENGATASVTFEIPPGRASEPRSLWMQIHGLAYRDMVSVQINSSEWLPLNNDTVAVAEPGKSYGGIGGGFSTLKMTLPLPSRAIVEGANTLRFASTIPMASSAASSWPSIFLPAITPRAGPRLVTQEDQVARRRCANPLR